MPETEAVRNDAVAKRLAEIGHLAGRVAHDISNLLTPLTAYPELVRRDLPAGSRGRELLGIMEDTIRDITRINQQMLTLSTRASTEKHDFSVSATITRLLTLIREGNDIPEGIEIVSDLCEGADTVHGDPEQVLRVTQNLCQNAFAAMNGDGRLSISVRPCELNSLPDPNVTATPGPYVHVAVSDTGTGIDPEIMKRIFEPFFTTKRESPQRGSGLGLSIVRDIMNDYEGYVSVATEASNGTTFDLYFPAAARTPTPDPAATESKSMAAPLSSAEDAGLNGAIDLIIVDDEPHIRTIFRLVLSSAFPQARIDTAANGREAVEACRRTHYNVVVMDLRMPVMDGREAFGQIQSLYQETKKKMPAFIFCTGFAPPDVIKEIVGDDDEHCLLSKPLRSEALVSRVRSRLGV